MKKRVLLIAVLLVVWAAVVVAAAVATGTEDPTAVMVWTATFVAGVVAMFVIQFVKLILVKILGELLTSRLMGYVAWGMSYAIAALVFALFGGWPVIVNQGFAIFAIGSTVGKLADMVYKTLPATIGGKTLSQKGWAK